MTATARLHDPALAATLAEALGAIAPDANSSALARTAVAVLEGHLAQPPRPRNVTQAHLRIVYLLAESQGSTHTRLRRAWDAKSARSGPSAWPWISSSGLRTRCSELASWGLLEPTGARGETAAGRPSRIWSLTGVDPRSLGRDVLAPGKVTQDARTALARLLVEASPDVTIRAQLELAASVLGVTR